MMDQYNVIQLTSDIDDLNNDMVKWANMPYDRRLRSDENCIRLYGMTNIELFNRLKAFILDKEVPENPELLGSAISESAEVVSVSYSNMSEEDLIWRIEMSEELNSSPYVAIVHPYKELNAQENAEDLAYIYDKYVKLTDKNKRFSNSYSMDLWGYNVPNMFRIVSNQLQNSNEENTDDKYIFIGEESSFMNPIYELANNLIINDDKLGLLKIKLDNMNESIRDCDVIDCNKINNLIDSNMKYNFESSLESVTPFFTVEEMNNNILSNYKGNKVTHENYSTILKSAIKDYKLNPCKETENILESLGWIPGIEFNEYNINVARKRNVEWFNENAPRIIDLTKYKNNSTINLLESTAKMRKQYKEKDLYPVYIVLSFTNTLFGKIIRKIKKSTYTHAGISLDSDLTQILTFEFDDIKDKGFSIENLDKYTGKFDNALLSVLCVFIDKDTKKSLEKAIQYFVNVKDKTKYNFGNLINILRNKAKDNDPENLSMVCSQFVDTLLKLVGIDITDKSSNLVIPQDFQNIKNPKVFKLYNGLAKEYNEAELENLIYSIFSTKERKQILYSKLIDQLEESVFAVSDYRYTIADNDKANDVLQEINNLLTPEAVIYERKTITILTPEAVIYERKTITITDDGNVSIRLMKSLEQEYQEAHKLLTTYSEDNLDGIKHELARLFYVNNIIEKKIKKMSKDNDKYKDLIDLRARVLNDFKKYLKVVLTKEPNFDFAEYYQKSEYANVEIDKSVLTYLGELIKKILKK